MRCRVIVFVPRLSTSMRRLAVVLSSSVMSSGVTVMFASP
jgi:hypothetical protein